MNQKVLSGLTATLFMATLGTPLASSANPIGTVDPVVEANPNQASTHTVTSEPASINAAVKADPQPSQAEQQTDEATAFDQTSASDLTPTRAVVKLGEQLQPSTVASAERETIAKVQAHDLAGRKAATLYVRNIPVLTLTGSNSASATTVKAPLVKMGSRQTDATENAIATAKSLNSADKSSAAPAEAAAQSSEATQANANVAQSDPVLRAAAIAAKINQLNRDGVDASTITVSWNAQSSKATATDERYVIKADKTLIAVIDATTVLPDTTRSLEKDALQAANRLRRLLGNASPLNSVTGKPNNWSQVAVGAIRQKLSGMASWYGPGFHGNPSASGERFNQNAMTAAHRTLPFGTKVVVTNINNGQSVVVRINDRGPFSGDRVIDLSAGAARMLGLIQSGVAPVRLDVLENSPRAITAGN
ncbi:septal ring lytic transglycosylase RlpA family protein [Leptolyngbya sp. FACHB-321]|uniref:septal ring lytic transglycosylase RlpA family protein n=1 Tax=Leptolyngbya sp. FACHB-321 TaxID=2692807 RepID=UPI0016820042|nr:septal ring lytic transglycosylase RlpA family protein [Leptolyngbya sp. FACHB-321]MBD2033995.1 septal ring lytic transglycosylase RlpA family protein [Leptolyngbya sp. FACHB-321]